jgi:hypothetical protein
VQNGGGHMLATPSGKRKGIYRPRADLLVQLLANAVQPDLSALKRMPGISPVSSTLVPPNTPSRKQFDSFGEIVGGLLDKIRNFALSHCSFRIVGP